MFNQRVYDQDLFDKSYDGDLDGVVIRLYRGANVLARNNGRTVLHAALGNSIVGADNKYVIKLLIDKIEERLRDTRETKKFINAKDNQGDTALMLAVEHGNADVTRMLLDYGADTEVRGNDGRTAFQVALNKSIPGFENRQVIMRMLLDQIKETRNLNQYEYINAQDGITGDTLLMWAAKHGYAKSTKLLLGFGAETEVRNNNGFTALQWAFKNNQKEIVRLLMNKIKETPQSLSQCINAKDTRGNTLLMWAAEYGYENAAQILLDNGADTEIRNNDGMTALQLALKENEKGVVRLLVKIKERQSLGQYINAQDTRGNTLLMWAAKNGYENATQILLDYGADTEVRNIYGMTALYLAEKEGKRNVAEVLKAKGADMYAEDKNGKMPIDFARKLCSGTATGSSSVAGSAGEVTKAKESTIRKVVKAVEESGVPEFAGNVVAIAGLGAVAIVANGAKLVFDMAAGIWGIFADAPPPARNWVDTRNQASPCTCPQCPAPRHYRRRF